MRVSKTRCVNGSCLPWTCRRANAGMTTRGRAIRCLMPPTPISLPGTSCVLTTRSARLNLITHLLKQIPYEPISRKKVKLPKRDMKHAYDDEATMVKRRWIPALY